MTESDQEEVETVDEEGQYDRESTLICSLPGATDRNPAVSATMAGNI